MPKKPKTHPEDAAKAVFRIHTRKPQDVVTLTGQLAERIKANPECPNKPAMQQAVTTITGIADTLDKQETDVRPRGRTSPRCSRGGRSARRPGSDTVSLDRTGGSCGSITVSVDETDGSSGSITVSVDRTDAFSGTSTVTLADSEQWASSVTVTVAERRSSLR
jgi:hypothetical protein